VGAGLLPAQFAFGVQPNAMLALSPKGEYKGVTLRHSVCYYGRKEKWGHTRRLQRRISPLCSSVGCLLGYPLVLHTGRFLRLFRQRKSLPSYFFILL